jgi:long-chain acyl-CoA synthetase
VRTLADYCQAALARDGEAIEFEGRWYSWPELRAVADRIEALVEEGGSLTGASIALVAPNRPWAVAAEFGLVAAGRTIKMLYPFQGASALAVSLDRMNAAVLVGEEAVFEGDVKAVMASSQMAGIVVSGMDARLLQGFERVGVAESNDPEEAALEILTSGTTGAPKPFRVTHRMIAEHYVEPALGAASKDAAPALIYAPLANISGLYMTFAPLISGQRAVLWDRFALDKWLDYVRTCRPAHSGIPCAMVQALLDADVPAEDLSSIKSMGMGAAPLDPTLQAAFEDRYGIPMLVSYGATEFSGPVTRMTLDDVVQFGIAKRGSVGRPIVNANVRAVDEQSGVVCGPNEEGLIEVVSPRLGADWIRTSDIGSVDDDGFVWLNGRADGAIMRGGFKILPEVVERMLRTHAAVAEVAVVSVDDARVGQVPGTVVVAKKGYNLDVGSLEQHVRLKLSAPHVPVHWKVVEALPINAAAKVDRVALKALFEAD